MNEAAITSMQCKASMKLLGDYWTLRIIDSLHQNDVRFCELQRNVDNLNPVTLTSRLKKLEKAKLIKRTIDPSDKVAVCYSLTSLGKEALPVIRAMDIFANKAQKHQ